MKQQNAPLLQVKQLQLQLGQHRWMHDVQVAAGECLLVMGASGCGKTSLLEGLAGFLPAVSGSIQVAGREVSHLPVSERPFSLLFQQHNFFEHLSIEQNLRLGFPHGKPDTAQWQTLLNACETLHVSGFLNSQPKQLSGGQRQRLALIRTVLRPQPILLLDEPFSALDSQLRTIARDWLKQHITQQQKAAVIVTHLQEDADVLGGQVLRL